jgi:hypothetical protein
LQRCAIHRYPNYAQAPAQRRRILQATANRGDDPATAPDLPSCVEHQKLIHTGSSQAPTCLRTTNTAKHKTALAVSELLQSYLNHSENTAEPKQSKTHSVPCCQQHPHSLLLYLQLQPAYPYARCGCRASSHMCCTASARQLRIHDDAPHLLQEAGGHQLHVTPQSHAAVQHAAHDRTSSTGTTNYTDTAMRTNTPQCPTKRTAACRLTLHQHIRTVPDEHQPCTSSTFTAYRLLRALPRHEVLPLRLVC